MRSSHDTQDGVHCLQRLPVSEHRHHQVEGLGRRDLPFEELDDIEGMFDPLPDAVSTESSGPSKTDAETLWDKIDQTEKKVDALSMELNECMTRLFHIVRAVDSISSAVCNGGDAPESAAAEPATVTKSRNKRAAR